LGSISAAAISWDLELKDKGLASEFPGVPVSYAIKESTWGAELGFVKSRYDASPAEVETGDQVEAANAGVILYCIEDDALYGVGCNVTIYYYGWTPDTCIDRWSRV